MAIDPRTPVIVGVAQAVHRDGDAPDPIEMVAAVAAAADGDAGAAGRLLARLDILAVPDIASRQVPDPAALAAGLLGVVPRATVRSVVGGDGPHTLVADICGAIARGEADVAVVAGAEALATLARAMRAGELPDWPAQDPAASPTRIVGTDHPNTSPAEQAVGLIAPIMIYPLFENALWARTGRTVDQERAHLGELWARFSAVAAGNPYAWARRAYSAEEIAVPSAGNRLVTHPYTKLLNSNIQTDQAAAVAICSVGAARSLGIAEDRWVFPHAAAGGHDHWFVSERADLASSPALGAAGRAALTHAGVAIDEIAHLDLYSCFPSAVQIAGAELGIDLATDTRPPTVTGGLTFAGGPGNNYVTHALAAMVQRLRDDPGSHGLVTAVGWYLTKHGVGIYSTDPPARPFAARSIQPEVDVLARRTVAEGYVGSAVAESASTLYERDGSPSLGMLTALLDDGRRVLASTRDADALAILTAEPVAGRPVRIGGSGGLEFEDR